MDPLVGLMIVALLIWAGVFVFIWFVDRRVSALERAIKEREGAAASLAAGKVGGAVSEKEFLSR